jgi:hypothetical protein
LDICFGDAPKAEEGDGPIRSSQDYNVRVYY